MIWPYAILGDNGHTIAEWIIPQVEEDSLLIQFNSLLLYCFTLVDNCYCIEGFIYIRRSII